MIVSVQINKLSAIEKAVKKAEKAILAYNEKASDPFRLIDVDRKYYSKAISILTKAKIEHKNILTELWNNGIMA